MINSWLSILGKLRALDLKGEKGKWNISQILLDKVRNKDIKQVSRSYQDGECYYNLGKLQN